MKRGGGEEGGRRGGGRRGGGVERRGDGACNHCKATS